jgi:hypothetical protein
LARRFFRGKTTCSFHPQSAYIVYTLSKFLFFHQRENKRENPLNPFPPSILEGQRTLEVDLSLSTIGAMKVYGIGGVYV